MKMLITQEEFENSLSRAMIPMACDYCDKPFTRQKNFLCRSIKNGSAVNCSVVCTNATKKKSDTFVVKECRKCGKEFTSRRTDETAHCSHSCAGKRPMSTAQKQRLREIGLGRKGPAKTLVEHAQCENCPMHFYKKRHTSRRYCKPCKTAIMRDKCRDREGMCRNRNSHAAWYESPIAGRVWLESSWELKCAMILDEHEIPWERPKQRFAWTDPNGVLRHYYPDFYLPLHDIYLDPKNPWQLQKDEFKLAQVKANHPITLLILDRAAIEEEAFLSLLKRYEPCTGDAPVSESYQDPILLLN